MGTSRLLSLRSSAWIVAWPLVLGGAARADVNLAEMVCFGDSLTDNQSILPWYEGNPATLYGHDPFELAFDKNHAPGDELSNYAVAGFTSGLVDLQIELYEFNTFFGFESKATLFQLEMGGNDVLNNDRLLASYAPGQNAEADRVIDDIIRNWRDYVKDLRQDARRDAQAIFWTIPDITATPRYYGAFTDQESANLRAHTERANAVIRGYDRSDSVIVLDMFELVQSWSEEVPIILGLELGAPPNYGETTDLFADEIHPTAVSNGLIANELIALINAEWGANLIGYTDEELLEFALNGGWNLVPAPGGAVLLSLAAVGVLGQRRRRGW